MEEKAAMRLVVSYTRGDMLTMEEITVLAKVIGIIGAAMAVSVVVRPNTSGIIAAQSRGMAGLVRAAAPKRVERCMRHYPLVNEPLKRKGELMSPEAVPACWVDKGHKGLHILPNGFAFSEEDIAWATEQLALIYDGR
jgi:hypothetical protein